MENTTQKDVAANIDTNENELVLMFGNGKQIKIAVDGLDAGIIRHATLHGLKQKLVDGAAIARNPETGRSATVEDKYNAVYDIYQRLLNGEWNKTREGGAGACGGLLFRALCRMYDRKTPDEIKAFLETKSRAEQAALRANAKIAGIIDEIRAERGADVDSDELLAGLDD